MESYVHIPYLHKLLNLAVTHGFHRLWTQSLIVPIFKNGDKSVPSKYRAIMISHIPTKIYMLILEKKLSLWLEIQGKRAKGQAGFRSHHSTIDHWSLLESLRRNVAIVKMISSVVLWILEKLSIMFLVISFGKDL